DSAPRSQFQVLRASGDLTNALTEFRALLGDPPYCCTRGRLDAGRREIKWDGVKSELTNTDALPADNFRANGLLYVDLGTGLRVSDNNFIDIDPSSPTQFKALSS